MLGMKVQASGNFERTIRAFRETGIVFDTRTMRALVGSAALSAQKLARVNLKDLVYTAPLPPSAGPRYLWNRRVGRVFRAVMVEPPVKEGNTWIGTCLVDRRMFLDYYYALILNYGGRTINYRPRPFWTRTERVMRARYAMIGREVIRNTRGQLLGHAVYGGPSAEPEAGNRWGI